MIVTCDDSGWGKPGCDGMAQAKSRYGVEVTISERITMADAKATMIDYATRGYDLIIGHGQVYSAPAVEIAAQFPNTTFAMYYGGHSAANVVSIDPKEHELAYLAGVIAGSMTKTGKIGYVGGAVIPAVVRHLKGFEQGIQSVRPDGKVLSVLDAGWDNPQIGKEAAEAMIKSGADIFFSGASAPGEGMIKAAAEHGLYSMGYATCQDFLAPKYVLTSTLNGIPETMEWIVKSYLEGSLKGGMVRPGLKDGIFSMCPYNDAVPKEVRDKVEKAKQDIIDGKIGRASCRERV